MSLQLWQWLIWLWYFFHTIPTSSNALDKLKVSVYYEALCPDSVNFFKRQLQHAYPVIGQRIDLDLVPYGKATHLKRNGRWVFSCHHGHNECYANQIQACAMNQRISQDNKVYFLLCLVNARGRSTFTNDNVIQMCGYQNGISMDLLHNCMRGELKDELLAKYGDQTIAVDPIINFVPTIIFNDHYSVDLQHDALQHFLTTICRQLIQPPESCPKP